VAVIIINIISCRLMSNLIFRKHGLVGDGQLRKTRFYYICWGTWGAV